MLAALLALSCAGAARAAGFQLVAHLQHHNLDALGATFSRVATPSSPDYLRHRSVAELASIIGSSDEELAAVAAWLEAAGGAGVEVSALRDTVSAAFDAGHRFTLGANGAPVKDARRPAAVQFVVRRDARSAAAGAPERRRPIASIKNPTVAEIKSAYGIPLDLQATNDRTTSMVCV
jgi:hypothetical protein